MKDKYNLLTYESINDLMLFKWEDGLESYINLKTLREKCPCANCEGEKDVFGNIYKGPPKMKTETSYKLTQIESIGYYGLRPHWGDHHDTGIFTFTLLKALGENP